jgi:hypothetical protein
MEAMNAGRLEEAPPAGSVERTAAAASVLPWYRRVAFWRAVAGMALAIAIGCAIVAAEFSSTLLTRTLHYHRRLRQLTSNLTAMRGKIASADREIAGMRTAAEVDDSLRRIIAEPDSRLIKLEAPGRATTPNGVVGFSPGLRRAAIEIGGLPKLPGDGAYTLWWMCGKRGPLRAGQMSPGAADKAALMIGLPAGGESIEGAIVTTDLTTDSQASIARPSSVLVLKGAVLPSPGRSGSPKHKGG